MIVWCACHPEDMPKSPVEKISAGLFFCPNLYQASFPIYIMIWNLLLQSFHSFRRIGAFFVLGEKRMSHYQMTKHQQLEI
jgi:hypothetical protein